LKNVEKRKLSYFGNIVRKCGSLEKEMMLGTLRRKTKNVVAGQHNSMDTISIRKDCEK